MTRATPASSAGAGRPKPRIREVMIVPTGMIPAKRPARSAPSIGRARYQRRKAIPLTRIAR
jgi:hypothetical protein